LIMHGPLAVYGVRCTVYGVWRVGGAVFLSDAI
jgi:hypothetical protein